MTIKQTIAAGIVALAPSFANAECAVDWIDARRVAAELANTNVQNWNRPLLESMGDKKLFEVSRELTRVLDQSTKRDTQFFDRIERAIDQEARAKEQAGGRQRPVDWTQVTRGAPEHLLSLAEKIQNGALTVSAARREAEASNGNAVVLGALAEIKPTGACLSVVAPAAPPAPAR